MSHKTINFQIPISLSQRENTPFRNDKLKKKLLRTTRQFQQRNLIINGEEIENCAFPNAKSFYFMNFSEAMFYDHENCLTSDLHTNTVISGRVCPLVKMASKTVIGRIMLARILKSKLSNTTLISWPDSTFALIIEDRFNFDSARST